MNTAIDGRYLVSTVGDLRFERGGKMETLGASGYFETYVFHAKFCDCGCGEYVISDGAEIDGVRCDTPVEARENHEEMCVRFEKEEQDA
jgi:hypothetical protein